MGRLFNKIARKVIKWYEKNHMVLAQNMNEYDTIYTEVNDDIKLISKEVATEGAVLLKNDDNILPIHKDKIVSVFGRCQIDYFDCGYGSGGDVKKPYTINLIDGLINEDVIINTELLDIYKKWREKPNNVVDPGFWGNWPYSHKEMKLSEEVIRNAKDKSDIAIIVIGRAAGEDRENKLKKGSFYLTDIEENNLKLITSIFDNVVVIVNSGNIIDFSFVNKYNFKGLVLAYQGGMESGNALALNLTGKANFSGKLTDTIAKEYSLYPSSSNFGARDYNFYKEDIYVGYRYFNTFKKEDILYPFGYGLSYTNFTIDPVLTSTKGTNVSIELLVKNIGKFSGKEVVELYLKKPSDKLKTPSYELIGYEKTKLLDINESTSLKFDIDIKEFASFDDYGYTGSKNSFVLEKGLYEFYYGNSVSSLKHLYSLKLNEDIVVKETKELFKIDKSFERMTRDNDIIVYEKVDKSNTMLKDRILESIKEPIPLNSNDYKLEDVYNNKISLDEFISSLTIEELDILSRGEGMMNSSLGEPGNAGAFGGISESLRKKGITPVITADGPSGVRVIRNSSLLPIGTMIASTWNKDLVKKLYTEVAKEAYERNIDILLSPGMNIHRDPLCGRNFEYYSEDPFLSGTMAAMAVNGIETHVFSCPKHFFGNNQETNRFQNDSIISLRAIREIYLKNFYYMLKYSNPHSIMTSYNKVNGVWSHYNYDSCVEFLRNEMGYSNNIITDWWMRYANSPEFENCYGNAYRVRSGVNVLMPGSISAINKEHGTSLMDSMNKGGLTIYELQNNARYILKNVLESNSFKRYMKNKDK